jgi:peroxiredoxin
LGLAERSARVGQPAPTFKLPRAGGGSVSLTDAVHTGPAVIVFYRGEWCPFCNLHMHAFEKALPKLQALGATLIAISPEKPDYGQLLADEQQLTFPVLSDLGNAVARRYGLVFQIDEETKELFVGSFSNDLAERNGDDSWELPVPATFVVDASGIIRFAHVDADYLTGRADPEEVLGVLRTLGE